MRAKVAMVIGGYVRSSRVISGRLSSRRCNASVASNAGSPSSRLRKPMPSRSPGDVVHHW